MIIALDRAIPYWEDAFSAFGDIRPFSGNELNPGDIREADVLIVRSITPVNAALLDGSRVRFVGAASAGVDHIDQDYLKKRGIRFSFAPGCNADAAAEYVITALDKLASRKGWRINEKSIAVIGVGNVGSRVAEKARVLGMEVLFCDPPLRQITGDARYQDFDRVLKADILSFHVPLVLEAPYPTWHMIAGSTLEMLSPEQYLINASRGAVVDNIELKASLRSGEIGGAVLDVWEGEPRIDYDLLKLVDIGTPHIAGTGLDGKINATLMIRAALCGFLGTESPGDTDDYFPEPQIIRPVEAFSDQAMISSVLGQVYDIEGDDAELRALNTLSIESAAERFYQLRNNHPLRPEFRHFVVELDKKYEYLCETFAGLGFNLRTSTAHKEA